MQERQRNIWHTWCNQASSSSFLHKQRFVCARVEPTNLFRIHGPDDTKQAPRHWGHWTPQILLLAATVVPPLESNLTLPHASIQGHAATQAKKLKYQHVCTTAGYGFIPLAMENRGLWSTEFKDFSNSVANIIQ